MAVWLALAGGFGALARYELAGWVQRRAWHLRPYGTLAVNLTGAFLLGLVTPLVPPQAGLAEVVGTGLLGGFTTFSTWMVETEGLFREGGRAGWLAALVNLGVMLAGGILGFALGLAIGDSIGTR
jgi:fluoride exporter